MPRLQWFVAIAAAVVCLGAWQPAAAVSTSTQREVEEALTCQCGCGLTVASCNHLDCSFAVPVRKYVAEQLAAGQTGEQILEHYKQQYGEKVLSSPVPEGFNLLAWIAPYVLITGAGLTMVLVFRRRARLALAEPVRPRRPASPDPLERPRSGAADDERLARLREEVEDLER